MATPPAVGWRLGVAAVLVLVAGAAVLRSCGTFDPLPPLPDYRDSLAVARATFAADTARAWGEARRQALIADSAIQVSRTAKAEAARLRGRRGVPIPVTYVPTPGTPDSTLMVPKVDYDSLVAEADSLWSVVRADSVAYAAQAERIAADSVAYVALSRLHANVGQIQQRQITDLQRDLARARRGCRLLGLLPCPEISAGWGATLTGGVVRTGPVLAVTLPVRF